MDGLGEAGRDGEMLRASRVQRARPRSQTAYWLRWRFARRDRATGRGAGEGGDSRTGTGATGQLTWSHDAWRLLPRSASDLVEKGRPRRCRRSLAPRSWQRRWMSFEPRDYLRHILVELDFLIR